MNTFAPSEADDVVVAELLNATWDTGGGRPRIVGERLKEIDGRPLPAMANITTAAVAEMLLKDQRQLDALLREKAGQRLLIPKLLGIAMCGFGIYGVAATVMLNLAHSYSGFWLVNTPPAFWNDGSVANLTLAYGLGLIAANGICLPSFYFYGLLSGVRISMLGVTAHALKGMAAGALALVGILPIYVATALSVVIYASNPWLLANYVLLALALPFLAGIWGAVCLYRGFIGLADTIPHGCREDRACLLRRLILAWSGCYTCVTPLVIYSLWQQFARVLH